MPDLADAVIDAIIGTSRRHEHGTRPTHATGVAATGWFQGSPVAPGHTASQHFDGRRVPVTVRFSTGTGEAMVRDSDPLVRGMAVKFHLGEVERLPGGVLRSAIETDLVSVTLPSFYVATMEHFMTLARAAAARTEPPAPAPSPWQTATGVLARVIRKVRIEPDLSQLPPADRALLEFANDHPPARLAAAAHGLLVVPESYATCAYHALHAFRLTAGTRTSFVRFHWEPVAGVRPVDPEADTEGRFLTRELPERIARGPVEFVLRIQVAEQGDDPSDPTVPWPQTRRRIVMGHLRLDAVPAAQDVASERMQFDPTRLVPGIDLSDDPVLQARREIYRRSAERRTSRA